MKLESSEMDCNDILSNLDSKYIVTSKVVQIPHYNANRHYPNNHTLNIVVKIDDEDYNNLMGDKKHLDDYVKINIVKFISINKEIIDELLLKEEENDDDD
jgi:hypothetical protein